MCSNSRMSEWSGKLSCTAVSIVKELTEIAKKPITEKITVAILEVRIMAVDNL